MIYEMSFVVMKKDGRKEALLPMWDARKESRKHIKCLPLLKAHAL
jgi:hypothetical protein